MVSYRRADRRQKAATMTYFLYHVSQKGQKQANLDADSVHRRSSSAGASSAGDSERDGLDVHLSRSKRAVQGDGVVPDQVNHAAADHSGTSRKERLSVRVNTL